MTACSPEDFEGMIESDVPQSSAYEGLVNITVNQDINQVRFSTGSKNVYGIWTIDTGKKTIKKIGNEFEEIFASAGDYNVTVQIANRNGISDGVISKSFHVNNTLFDFSKYINMLSKAPWYFDNAAKGHLACGPNVEDPTSWWSGDADCKASEGLYDNSLTFTTDMDYTFDPGAAGTMYVNKGTTIWGSGASEDFRVEVGPQTTTYGFEVEGDDLYLTFSANTQFPYIAFDECYTQPRYKVVNMSAKSMTLVAANNDIAWQYILTTSHEVKFTGFDVNSPDNLWKLANPTFKSLYYAHTGDWIGLPDFEHSEENGVFTVKLPTETQNQWQAQYAIETELNSSNVPADATYDFSCIITPNNDLKGVTLKLTSQDDNTSIIDQRVDLVGFEENVVYFTELPGKEIDGNYKFVFDFGGNPENTEITIKNIVLIDHTKNTIAPPSDDPGQGPAVKDWDIDAPANLWKAVEEGSAFVNVTPWFSGADWNGGITPEWNHDNGIWTVTIPEGTGVEQWKGQFPINTTLTASKDKKYNFYCVIESDTDCPGVTIKLTETDDPDGTKHDGNFFFDGRHPVTAGEMFIYKETEVTLPQNDAHALSLFFDFGGTPAGAVIKIHDIYFEEIKEVKYEAENNLWKEVDNGKAFLSVTPWFSGADWNGGITPDWNHQNGSDTWEITIPEGTGVEQWKGQFPINTTLTASKDKTYSYSVTILADNDCPGVTIKLVETDDPDGTKHDGNCFFDDRHAVAAGEEFVYTVTGAQLRQGDAHALSMFFDFGGTPAGTNVQIKKITFIEE